MSKKTEEKNELQQLKALLEKMEKKGYPNFMESMETQRFLVTVKKRS